MSVAESALRGKQSHWMDGADTGPAAQPARPPWTQALVRPQQSTVAANYSS